MEKICTELFLDREFDIYGLVEDPWFLAKNVAEVIGYRRGEVDTILKLVNSRDRIKTRVTSDTVSSGVRSRGNNLTRQMWLINERGFYDVLMRSGMDISNELRDELAKILYRMRRSGNLSSLEKFSQLSGKAMENIFFDMVLADRDLNEAIDSYHELEKSSDYHPLLSVER